jgi:serine/threonine-protein kinase RsbT
LHPHYQNLLSILERYVSRVNARVLLQRAIDEVGSSTVRPSPEELSRVGVNLRNGIGLFVTDAVRIEVSRTIVLACGEQAAPGPKTIPIRAESDVSLARSEARRLCESLGTTGFTVQKITTIVSELARNIVSYTDGGAIELSPRTDGFRRVHLVASDNGRGIANIEEVLSGSYRSRTGLGRGILGCRKLADRFDIETNDRGTRINVEVRL